MTDAIPSLTSGVVSKIIMDLYGKRKAESERFYQEYAEEPAYDDIFVTWLGKSKVHYDKQTVYFSESKVHFGKTTVVSSFILPVPPLRSRRLKQRKPGAAPPVETQTEVFTKDKEIEDVRRESDRLKAQVVECQFEAIEAKRRAEQADDRVDELLSQHRDFLALVKRVEAANKDIQRGLAAKRTGRPCLHDKSEGYVSRRLDDEHVAIEFEMSDDRVVEQIHHRDQFVDGKLPREGDRMEAHFLAWFHSPEPADASKYLTAEEMEHGFPGFRKAIERRRKEEQADES